MAGEDGDYVDSNLRFFDDNELSDDETNFFECEPDCNGVRSEEDTRGNPLQPMNDGKRAYNLSYAVFFPLLCCNPWFCLCLVFKKIQVAPHKLPSFFLQNNT